MEGNFPVLNEILNGDVNFAGLSGDVAEGLLGRIMQLPAQQKAQAVAALVKRGAAQGASSGLAPQTGSRAEIMRNFHLLPTDVQTALLQKRAQLVDSTYYVTKYAEGAQTLKMFADDDNKIVGVTNMSGQKLPKGEFFMLHAIRLTSADTTVTSVAAATNAVLNFGVAIDAILNGEFKLNVGGKIVVPERTPLRVFDTTNNNHANEGLWKLDNPKLIQPQVDVVMDLEWGLAVNGTNNTIVRVELIGTTVVPF